MLSRVLRRAREGGQTTVEYALVILGAGLLALLLVAWAKGGAIKGIFDDVLGQLGL